jgi:hypothetical protein
MFLYDGLDIFDVIKDMPCLHFDHPSDGDTFFPPFRRLQPNGLFPRFSSLLDQFDGVTAIRAQKRQRRLDIAAGVFPIRRPFHLRLVPIPLQRKSAIAVTERGFDANLPDVVAIGKMMDDLTDRPGISAQGKVKVCFGETSQG